MSLLHCLLRKEVGNASLLYEVPKKGGDQESTVNHAQEQAPGNERCLPQLWHQSLPHWQVVSLLNFGALVESGKSKHTGLAFGLLDLRQALK